ncbi:MAG TPA: hypothetical protein VGC35_07765 [Allosphingosinicella sp.]|jgi:hypothetical protein
MISLSVRHAVALLVACAALTPAASAQEMPQGPVGKAFALPFGPVPSELHGVACEAQPGNADFAPSLRCSAQDPLKQPSISVAVADQPNRPTRAALIANERSAFQNRPIFNVIREEDFVPPGDPAAIGYRALYQTELGNRYVWAVHSNGKLVRVLVIVFAPTDFAAMITDIESKVFGVAASSAAAAKEE